MACTFDVLLIGYDVTIVDGDVAHVGVGMSRSRGCSEQYGPSVRPSGSSANPLSVSLSVATYCFVAVR